MEEWTRRRTPEEASRLIAEILTLADRLRSRLDAPCEEHGVSSSRFGVLAAVSDAGEDGCSQTELAERLELSESNVSALIEGLRKSGLLFRFRSKVDRRRSVLLLSEAGKDLLCVLARARALVTASLVEGVTDEQLHELRRLLNALGSRLGEAAPSSRTASDTGSTSWRRAS